jgi:4-amino-4-deoxy-L-arabinose transferase-like glycosyltransferase
LPISEQWLMMKRNLAAAVSPVSRGKMMNAGVPAISNPETGITAPLHSRRKWSWVRIAAVVFLLLVLESQLLYSVKHESLTFDEGDHIFAGYMSLKHRDFGLNPEHPPLVKMLAAVPLLRMNLNEPELQNRYFKTEAYLSGRDFIFQGDHETIIFRARMAASFFALLVALLAFLTAREMFSTGAGFIALVLIVFEPNFLAHGALVTTDTGAAAALLASIYAFYRYVKSPSWGRVIVLGLAAGLFFVVKHSAVLLPPMLILLAITELLRRRRAGDESRFHQAARLAGALVVTGVIAAAVIWACYGFRYAARPSGSQLNPPMQSTLGNLRPAEAKAITMMARWKLLPESWLYGLADVRSVANTWPSYMFGKIYAHGVWFYFPVAFVIKATVTTLIFVPLIVYAVATGKLRGSREILFLSLPPALYFCISMTSSLNIGIRHVLLVFIFLLVLAGGAAWSLIRNDRRWAWPIAVLILFHVVSSLRAFPTSYIPYANELWGGPANIHKYLTDSTTDWGQQLKAVKRYIDERGIKQCWFAYTAEPLIPFHAYGIPCQTLPTMDTIWSGLKTETPAVIQGPVFFSHISLTFYESGSALLSPYREFMELKPTAVIEDGVFVYDGTFNVPYAAAMDRAVISGNLLEQHQPEQALSEAQAAIALAPDSLQALMALGDAQKALRKNAEARTAFETALRRVHLMEPTAQEVWIPRIQEKMAGL